MVKNRDVSVIWAEFRPTRTSAQFDPGWSSGESGELRAGDRRYLSSRSRRQQDAANLLRQSYAGMLWASSISFLTPTNGLRNTAPIRCPQANLSPAFPAAVARRIRPRARPHQPGGEPCGHRRRRDRATDRGSFCLKDRPPPQHRRLTSNNRSPYRQANTAGQCEKRTRSQPRLHVLGRRSLCLPADAALYSDQRGLGAGPIWQLLPKLDHAC